MDCYRFVFAPIWTIPFVFWKWTQTHRYSLVYFNGKNGLVCNVPGCAVLFCGAWQKFLKHPLIFLTIYIGPLWVFLVLQNERGLKWCHFNSVKNQISALTTLNSILIQNFQKCFHWWKNKIGQTCGNTFTPQVVTSLTY